MPRFEDVFIVRQDKSKPHPVWGIYDKQKKEFVARARWESEARCQEFLASAIQEARARRWSRMQAEIQARLDAWDAIMNEPCSDEDQKTFNQSDIS